MLAHSLDMIFDPIHKSSLYNLVCMQTMSTDIMSTDKMSNRHFEILKYAFENVYLTFYLFRNFVCRHHVCIPLDINQIYEILKYTVEQTKCRQTKCRTDKMSTNKMHVTPYMQNTEDSIAKVGVDPSDQGPPILKKISSPWTFFSGG